MPRLILSEIRPWALNRRSKRTKDFASPDKKLATLVPGFPRGWLPIGARNRFATLMGEQRTGDVEVKIAAQNPHLRQAIRIFRALLRSERRMALRFSQRL